MFVDEKTIKITVTCKLRLIIGLDNSGEYIRKRKKEN
jgi:hypothetical protein